jgi:hypothetical protein
LSDFEKVFCWLKNIFVLIAGWLLFFVFREKDLFLLFLKDVL